MASVKVGQALICLHFSIRKRDEPGVLKAPVDGIGFRLRLTPNQGGQRLLGLRILLRCMI